MSVRRTVMAALAAGLVTAACSGGSSADSGAIATEPVAQFTTRCDFSHAAFDDPLVLPWQPGKSHLHLFFGNRAVDSSPGYDNRILAAPTSCDNELDTGSYWAPALLDGDGRAVEPIELTATFRSGDGVDPAEVVAFPEGLMLIGGSASAVEAQPTPILGWLCAGETQRQPAPGQCGEGSTLHMQVTFPDCWDGNRLTGFGSSAHAEYSDGGCPETHPVAMPQLTIDIAYPPLSPESLSLSSGAIETAHADFWNVWDQDKLEADVERCINASIVCRVST